MLMDALRARRRHPPASHALAALSSPPASDRLAPAGLPAPLGSPAAGGGRGPLWPKRPRWWRSTLISSRCSTRTSASPALPPPAWRRRAARPGTPMPLRACLRRRQEPLVPPQRVGQPIPCRPHRQGQRGLGRAAAPAAADLRRSVQSGPRFRGEGDSDGLAGWKCWLLGGLVGFVTLGTTFGGSSGTPETPTTPDPEGPVRADLADLRGPYAAPRSPRRQQQSDGRHPAVLSSSPCGLFHLPVSEGLLRTYLPGLQ
ncbi:uncharacterized protein [Manis javanica]|uniref:uncharacterized protein isoform X1 n=1 Tax=Manis javanica TaxID=9974 RepID=UPI003C6D90DE